jgi:hypothetical protein
MVQHAIELPRFLQIDDIQSFFTDMRSRNGVAKLERGRIKARIRERLRESWHAFLGQKK